MDKEKIMTTNTTVLVTGGSGYVGLQCILQLLEEGFTVKTTVRSLTKKDEIIEILKTMAFLLLKN